MTLYFFENQFDHFTTRHHDRVPYQNWERAVIRLNSSLGFQAKNTQVKRTQQFRLQGASGVAEKNSCEKQRIVMTVVLSW